MATPLNSGAASFVLRIHSGGEGSRRSLIQAKRCHSRRKGSSKEEVGLKRKRGRFQNSQAPSQLKGQFKVSVRLCAMNKSMYLRKMGR